MDVSSSREISWNKIATKNFGGCTYRREAVQGSGANLMSSKYCENIHRPELDSVLDSDRSTREYLFGTSKYSIGKNIRSRYWENKISTSCWVTIRSRQWEGGIITIQHFLRSWPEWFLIDVDLLIYIHFPDKRVRKSLSKDSERKFKGKIVMFELFTLPCFPRPYGRGNPIQDSGI